ncbi:TerD family protein [Zymomonas mobilis]|uniref:Stress protein n=1 Tax=Zymomonas mobilis subsp. pomaceae (strain ATCC 29192 / DSM 22645 / JCM 10191 / CCUG 17912 / NBRC 13757 / NCIMB 11200 / NRRL B-4491 / Barker I) TaxID=579138 RepID=F8ET24_ZYMMT|nr:TerD family protein [Zymomonas mobilis]AEI37928.1 stress protein [Zymomonas mobilis subsp. pomaceae ATCC 29192]MDX5949297.1 TerD family protein [Zymomonas mobilis subsp. pomaceae]GEB89696.1 chemical-damaging agent resistance protein C [Zymomonas mobilis subsp. pomaceae]
MAISLQKGGNLSLTKTDASLDVVLVGLGWDVRASDGADFDLDASAFLLRKDGHVRNDMDFCFYNQTVVGNGAVEHQGDNLTGSGDGDDEQIKLTLSKVPTDIEKIAIAVTIHDFEARRQNFGMVSNAYIRLVNEKTGVEVVRYDLSEDASTETAMIFAELYRKDSGWSFRAIGQGYNGGLGPLAKNYGVNI